MNPIFILEIFIILSKYNSNFEWTTFKKLTDGMLYLANCDITFVSVMTIINLFSLMFSYDTLLLVVYYKKIYQGPQHSEIHTISRGKKS